MSSLPKNITDAELLLIAYRGRETLRARLKVFAREHSDRIRKLDGLMHRINAKPHTNGDELAGTTGVSIEPDLEKLLVNPVHGL
jgi:hypothetical protein